MGALANGKKAGMPASTLAAWRRDFDERRQKPAREALEEALYCDCVEVLDAAMALALHIKEAATRTSSTRFQRHIDALATLLEKGEEVGVDEDVLVLAREAAVHAQQDLQSELCDICFDQADTS